MRFTIVITTVLATVATIMSMTTLADASYDGQMLNDLNNFRHGKKELALKVDYNLNNMADKHNKLQQQRGHPITNLYLNNMKLKNFKTIPGDWSGYDVLVGRGYVDMKDFLRQRYAKDQYTPNYTHAGISKNAGKNGPWYTIIMAKKL